LAGSHRRHPRVTLIIAILASFTLLTVGGEGVPVLGSVRSLVIDVLTPVQNVVSSATKPIRSWWGGATDYDSVVAENRELREQVERLEAKQARNANASAELEELQRQLNLPFVGTIPTVTAQLAAGPFSSFDNTTVRINKGSAAGIKVDMPVVTSDGLVGKILSVTPKHAVVRLINDYDFFVGVKLTDSGNLAVGHGRGPNASFLIEEGVELNSEVTKGAPIVTSGLERAAFPKDLPIGQVKQVTRSSFAQTQEVEVELYANLESMNAVDVLLWERPK
jgi:rod shape-determining protein MreC